MTAIGPILFNCKRKMAENEAGWRRSAHLKMHPPRSPTDRHGQLLAEAVMVMELPILGPIFVHEFGELHVVTAIFGDFEQLAFPKPVDCLHALGGFLDAEGGCDDGIQ